MVWFTIHNNVCILSLYLTNLFSMVITSETNSLTQVSKKTYSEKPQGTAKAGHSLNPHVQQTLCTMTKQEENPTSKLTPLL